MRNEGFYVKKHINPRIQFLNQNPNLVYYNQGKALKFANNNIIFTTVNNFNKLALNPNNNEFLYQNQQFQNGQIFYGINNIKKPNQNLMNNNYNNFGINEESKLSNEGIIPVVKGFTNNYVFINNINNNQPQNQMYINPNNNGIIYVPNTANYLNRVPINNINNNITPNPGINQQVLLRQNVGHIIQRPIVPVKKKLITNEFNTPHKNNLKKYIYNQQKYATVQDESKYDLENLDYTSPLTDRNNRDNLINNKQDDENDDQYSENNGYCSKNVDNNKALLNNTFDDISTPVKSKNNEINDLFNLNKSPLDNKNNNEEENYLRYSNNTVDTPTNNLTLSPQQIYSKPKPIHTKQQSNRLTLAFHNYNQINSNNNNIFTSPKRTPIKSPSQNQNNEKISIKNFSYLSRAGSE